MHIIHIAHTSSTPTFPFIQPQTNIACIPATTTPTANPTTPLAPPSTAGSAPLVEFDEDEELPEFELTLAAELVEFEYGNDVFVFVSAYMFVAGIFEQFPIGLIYVQNPTHFIFSTPNSILCKEMRHVKLRAGIRMFVILEG